MSTRLVLLLRFGTSRCLKFVHIIWGQRVIGISGFLIWSETLMELIFNSVVNFGEVQRAQLAKSTLLTSPLVPLGSFQIS